MPPGVGASPNSSGSAETSNAKGELIAACQSLGLPAPTFASESGGPGHAPRFRCTVRLGDTVAGEGEGPSKKDAERSASLAALETIAAPVSAGVSSTPPAAIMPTQERWPVYAALLSQSLQVAHERGTRQTIAEVAQDAALLYRQLLQELGHAPELT